jgi:glycerol-3-phosphate dehydrogenase (NAD(P)+)
MSGPLFAHDLESGKPGYALFGSKSLTARKLIKQLFQKTHMTVETSNDTTGVAYAGILKNVYGIGMGMLDGIYAGDNMKSMYVVQAIDELKRAGVVCGGKKKTFEHACVIADFIATSYCAFSNHRTTGERISKGGEGGVCEGLMSLPFVLKKCKTKFPILEKIKAIVLDEKNSKEIF